jgi:biotin carboxyl carrier protein
MESMKMETAILAGAAGTVSELLVAPGSAVKRGTLLARIES